MLLIGFSQIFAAGPKTLTLIWAQSKKSAEA